MLNIVNNIITALYNSELYNTFENKDFILIRIKNGTFLIFKHYDFPTLFYSRFELEKILQTYFKNNENAFLIKPPDFKKYLCYGISYDKYRINL